MEYHNYNLIIMEYYNYNSKKDLEYDLLVACRAGGRVDGEREIHLLYYPSVPRMPCKHLY